MKLFLLFACAVACAAQPTMIDYNTQVKNKPINLVNGTWAFPSPASFTVNGGGQALTVTGASTFNGAVTINGATTYNGLVSTPNFATRRLTLLDSSPSQFNSGWSLTAQSGPIANGFTLADPSATARFTWSLVQTGFFYNHAIFEPTATVDIGTLAVAAGSGATVRCTSCGVALNVTAATGANTAIKGTAAGTNSFAVFGSNTTGYGGWFESTSGRALYVNGVSAFNGAAGFGGVVTLNGNLVSNTTSLFNSDTTFNGAVVMNGGCTGCSGLTPPVTISGTTSGALLTLTNYGAGNALTADGTIRATAHTGANQKAVYGEATDVNSFAVYGKNTSGYGGWFESATGRALYANGTSTFNGDAGFGGLVTLNGNLASNTTSVFNSDTTFNGDVTMTCAGCSTGLTINCASCGVGLSVSAITTAIVGYTSSSSAYPLNISGMSTTRLATFNNAGGGCNLLVAGLTCTSDRRLKQHISPLAPALARVMQLKPVGFDWIKTGAHADGLIAQDVQKVFPLAVNEDESGMLSLNSQQLVPYLIKAIQEQQTEIEELKRRLK